MNVRRLKHLIPHLAVRHTAILGLSKANLLILGMGQDILTLLRAFTVCLWRRQRLCMSFTLADIRKMTVIKTTLFNGKTQPWCP